jgi:hypothetical protein
MGFFMSKKQKKAMKDRRRKKILGEKVYFLIQPYLQVPVLSIRRSAHVETGRRGWSAELSQRRGSLKKRDRRAKKAARAEAAIERKTVYLLEHVCHLYNSNVTYGMAGFVRSNTRVSRSSIF